MENNSLIDIVLNIIQNTQNIIQNNTDELNIINNFINRRILYNNNRINAFLNHSINIDITHEFINNIINDIEISLGENNDPNLQFQIEDVMSQQIRENMYRLDENNDSILTDVFYLIFLWGYHHRISIKNIIENILILYIELDDQYKNIIKKHIILAYEKCIEYLINNRVIIFTIDIRDQNNSILTDEEFNKLNIVQFKDELCDKCSICQENFNEVDIITELPCSINKYHYYHKDCIYEWTTKHSAVCPICKTDIKNIINNS